MKTLLIGPNSEFAIKSVLGVTGPPLGLAYIASYLREKGQPEVRILDALKMDLTLDETVEEIRKYKPDVIGLSVIATPSIYDSYKLAEAVKENDSDVFVALGGTHPTFASTEILEECPHIDAVVKMEGEKTMKELLESLELGKDLKRVLGLTYRTQNGKIIETPPRPFIDDLDSLPFPAYDLLPMEEYRMGNHRFGTIITSRGCPYRCIFCSSSELMGRKWRARSAENVVEELKILRHEYDIRNIELMDDTFTLNPKRTEEICRSIMDERLDISWTCSSRVDTIANFPHLASTLREAGCHTIYVGAESGSQRVLDIMKKGITVEQTKKAVRVLKEASMSVLGSFVIGTPGETRGDIELTIKLAKRLDIDLAQFTICTPYIGTPLYNEAVSKGWSLSRDWRRFDVITPVMEIAGVNLNELNHLLRRAYVEFYTQPSFLWKQIKSRNFFVIKKAFIAGIRYIFHNFIQKIGAEKTDSNRAVSLEDGH